MQPYCSRASLYLLAQPFADLPLDKQVAAHSQQMDPHSLEILYGRGVRITRDDGERLGRAGKPLPLLIHVERLQISTACE